MTFQGELEVDNTKYKIISLDLSFHQQIDSTGKPCANPGGGIIQVTLDSTGDNNVLLQWMISPDSSKDVTIYFANYDMGKPRKIFLAKAFCVGYHEHFESTGNSPAIITLTLSAQTITCGEAKLEKKWASAK
jgi:hypothetical protein